MQTQIPENKNFDRLISESLASDRNLCIPTDFSEKTIRRIQRRMLLRELVLELLMKIGVVLGSLCLLLVAFVYLKDKSMIPYLLTIIMNYWLPVTITLSAFFLVLFFDQIVLKFKLLSHKSAYMKV